MEMSKATYYVLFRDYSVWVAYDESFSTRKAALEYLTQQSGKYPMTQMRVATQLQADRLMAE